MSLKYHIIHFIVKDMEKQLEIDQKKVRKKPFFNSSDQIASCCPLLITTVCNTFNSQIVSPSKSIGAACKVTFFGSLDKVAADWERT